MVILEHICNTLNEILHIRKTFNILLLAEVSVEEPGKQSSSDSYFPTLLSAFVCLLLM